MTLPSFLHWSAGWWLVLDALAVYRLSRLVSRDLIFQPFRRWMDSRYEGGWLLDLITCIWCLSVWFAAGVVLLTWWQPYAWSFAAAGLAFSAVAGLVGERVG